MTDNTENTSANLPLYERIGGEFTLNAAIDGFYEKIENERRLAVFFENVSFAKQIEKQKTFMQMAMGKPGPDMGNLLRRAHKPLLDRGLNDTHVDIFIELFAETLRELDIEESLVQEVSALANKYRDDVMNR